MIASLARIREQPAGWTAMSSHAGHVFEHGSGLRVRVSAKLAAALGIERQIAESCASCTNSS